MHSIVFYMKGGGHMAADQQSLDIAAIYERHSKTVYRVCFAFMKNHADTEDAVQETFFRLIRKQPTFETPDRHPGAGNIGICGDHGGDHGVVGAI